LLLVLRSVKDFLLITDLLYMTLIPGIVKVVALRVEYLENPMGVGELYPRLSWIIETDRENWVQVAYEIRAADSPEALKDVNTLWWDTGKVDGDQSTNVEYNGPELRSEQRIWWQVRVWSHQGECSEWSEPSFWQMSLLSSEDWRASWIQPDFNEDVSQSYPAAYMRKEFELPEKCSIKRATVHVTAQGLFELHLNGEKVSEDLFTPGWTSYNKRLQFLSYDVTGHLCEGSNCLGSVLGDGWFRGPINWQLRRHTYGEKTALLCQLHIQFEDGSEQWVLSDHSWKANTGPILKSEIYDGEVYDARLEHEGWSEAGFVENGWKHCMEAPIGYDVLTASCSEPVRVTERLSPKEILTTPKGEVVIDFGQNLVGRVILELSGKAGEKIVIDHAEVLDPDGNFYTDNLRQAKQRLEYTFAGRGGAETFVPHFTFMGFRYIRITGYSPEIHRDAFRAEAFHSDMAMTGSFECSDPLINRLQANICWSLRGNFVDVPTDCPQRDERLGWTGDAQVFAPTACFNANAAPFFTKWLKDIAADQREDGSVPWVVPNVVENGGGTGWSDGFGSTAWADVAVTLPWELYLKYEDRRVLRNQYGSMRAWVEYMIHHAGERYIFDQGFHFGDWLSFAEYMSYHFAAPDYGYAGAHTDKDLIATAYFYHCTRIIGDTAEILGFSDDAGRYRCLLPKIQNAFVEEFVTDTGRLASNTQTAYAVAIAFGVLPDRFRESAKQRLVKDIQDLGHLTTGFVGTPILSDTLTELGCEEQAYQLLFNKRYPSWLFPVIQGATTIWERWDGIKPDGSFQDVGMNSFNHYAYGSVGNWLYSHVAGLQVDTAKPGYKHFIVRPVLTPLLSYVNLTYESPSGKIGIRWELEGSRFLLKVIVPPNTSATIHVPKASASGSVSTKQVFSLPVTYTVSEVGSGTHEFRSVLY
jgi:alpha-L-rhamnosidase